MADVIKPGKHIDKITRRMMELINAFEGVELGETHDKAYYGDLGKEAYEHSQLRSGNPHNVTARECPHGSSWNEGKLAKPRRRLDGRS